jgi:hypothetical protein
MGFISPAAARPWLGLVAAVAFLTLAAAEPARAAPEPLFSHSPAAPFTNEPVTFTSGATGVTQQTWDLDEDGVCDDASGETAVRSFPLAGSYWIKLCVSDGTHWWTDSSKVAISNRVPIASFTYAPQPPQAGDRILFTSISADPDGPIAAQAWDLNGDGRFDDASGPTAEWTFPTAGGFLVSLAVTDNNGATTVATLTVPVLERPAEPIAPFPLVSMLAAVGNSGTRIRELVVRAPPGARVGVRCRGSRCPFRSFALERRAHSPRVIRIHRLRRHMLRPGTIIEIRVTKRGRIGKFTRFRVRAGKPPRRTDRCLPPGSKRPVRCSSS